MLWRRHKLEGIMLDRVRLIGDAIERMGIVARRRWLGAIVGSDPCHS
jgi:hypothetical protein